MPRLLVHLALYCGVPNLGGCLLFSDNMALVNITKAFKPHIQTSPNATLASDWDVITEIHHNLYHNVPPFKQTIAHVKGHQDKTVEYEKLSLAAQLNVDADHMAEPRTTKSPGWNDYLQSESVDSLCGWSPRSETIYPKAHQMEQQSHGLH